MVRRALAGLMLAGLVLALAVPAAHANEPCLGIDGNGDGVVDVAPAEGSNCLIVPLMVEPEKNNIVDLDFHTVHAAIIDTPSFDPTRVANIPLCFGDADTPANRPCSPVTGRGKLRDVNNDGRKDMIWKWSTPATNIHPGDTSACINGRTTDGLNIEACDTMTVINGGVPAINVADAQVVEGDSGTTTATFAVTLTEASGTTVTVSYATVDGTAAAPADFQAVSGQLSFAPGETGKILPVTVNGDTDQEPDESFTVALSAPSGAVIGDGSGAGTILSDDVSSALFINDASVTEGDSGTTLATFTVSLSPAATDDVSVSWATADGTAGSADYVPASGSVTFTAGETTKSVSVEVLGDTTIESQETFFVNLSEGGVSISDGQGVGYISDDDVVPSITIHNTTVNETNTGVKVATFTVTLSTAVGHEVTVNYASVNGSAVAPADYTSVSGTLTFIPGQTLRTINVDVVGDTIDEANESFTVKLTNPVGATIFDGTGSCSIRDND